MRVLMLSWEYPPLVYGGLSPPRAGSVGVTHGRRPRRRRTHLTHRRRPAPMPSSGASGSSGFRGIRRCADRRPAGLDHGARPCAHPGGPRRRIGLATRGGPRPRLAGRPHRRHPQGSLVGSARRDRARHRGRPPPGLASRTLNQAINSLEWWLTYQARRVITCSQAMRWEVTGSSNCRPARSTSSPTASTRSGGSRPTRRAGTPGPSGPMPVRCCCSAAGWSTRRASTPSSTRCGDCVDGIQDCAWSSPVAGPRRMRCAPRPVGCGWDGRCVSPVGWTRRT
jgi:hypothetical protein